MLVPPLGGLWAETSFFRLLGGGYRVAAVYSDAAQNADMHLGYTVCPRDLNPRSIALMGHVGEL